MCFHKLWLMLGRCFHFLKLALFFQSSTSSLGHQYLSRRHCFILRLANNNLCIYQSIRKNTCIQYYLVLRTNRETLPFERWVNPEDSILSEIAKASLMGKQLFQLSDLINLCITSNREMQRKYWLACQV